MEVLYLSGAKSGSGMKMQADDLSVLSAEDPPSTAASITTGDRIETESNKTNSRKPSVSQRPSSTDRSFIRGAPSLENLRKNPPERSASAPPGPLLEEALLRSAAPASIGPAAAAYYSLWQPCFPPQFVITHSYDGGPYFISSDSQQLPDRFQNSKASTRRAGDTPGHWPPRNHPLYVLKTGQLNNNAPAVVLFSGPDMDKDSPWADVQFGTWGALGRGMTIGIPPLPHEMAWAPLAERNSAQSTPSDNGRSDEKLSIHFGWHNRYRFEVEVGSPYELFTRGADRRREMFEWRHCSRHEIEALQEAAGGLGEEDGLGEAHGLHPQRPNTSLGMTGDKAGQSLRHKISLGLLGGHSETDEDDKQPTVRRRPSRLFLQATLRKRTTWRGGWQLVRLSEATDPLAGAVHAASTLGLNITTIPEEEEGEDVPTGMASTPRVTQVEPLDLDGMIGDEARWAAERRRTMDGHEIVALWANAGSQTRTKREPDPEADAEDDTTSAPAVARFAFIGSGRAGQLGERWALMAVMTGLAIWEREQKASTRRRDAIVKACSGLASII